MKKARKLTHLTQDFHYKILWDFCSEKKTRKVSIFPEVLFDKKSLALFTLLLIFFFVASESIKMVSIEEVIEPEPQKPEPKGWFTSAYNEWDPEMLILLERWSYSGETALFAAK